MFKNKYIIGIVLAILTGFLQDSAVVQIWI